MFTCRVHALVLWINIAPRIAERDTPAPQRAPELILAILLYRIVNDRAVEARVCRGVCCAGVLNSRELAQFVAHAVERRNRRAESVGVSRMIMLGDMYCAQNSARPQNAHRVSALIGEVACRVAFAELRSLRRECRSMHFEVLSRECVHAFRHDRTERR